jgi:hypothetical protein
MLFSIKRTIFASIFAFPILILPTISVAGLPMNEVKQTKPPEAERNSYEFEFITLTEGYSINFKGNIEFDKNYGEVIAMGKTAYLYLEARSGFNDKSIEVISDENGKPVHTFKVEGKIKPFDSDAKEWLAEQVELLNSRIGIKAFTRVKKLMASAGFESVLSEIKRLEYIKFNLNAGYTASTGSVEAAYVEALLSNYPLNENQMIKLLNIVADNLGSQSSADMIISFANYFPKSKRLTSALINNSGQISSSSTSSETLLALKQAREIPEALRSTYLAAIENISSSSAQLETLKQSKNYCHTNDELLEQCIHIAKEMSSSNAQELLSELLTRPDISSKNISKLILAAQAISSSSAQGQYLQTLVNTNVLDDSNVQAFLNTAQEISSSTEHANTLKTLIDTQTLSELSWLNLMATIEDISSSSNALSVLNNTASKMPISKTTVKQYLDVALDVSSSSAQEQAIMALLQKELSIDYLLMVQRQISNKISSRSSRTAVQNKINVLLSQRKE